MAYDGTLKLDVAMDLSSFQGKITNLVDALTSVKITISQFP